MNIRSSDIYLNTLCLAAYAPGNTTIKIADAVVKMFDDLSTEERTMLSPMNILYVKLLREIATGNLDLSNRAEASSVLLRYQDDRAFENNKVTFGELQSLLIPDQLPAPQKIRTLFNRVKNNIAFFRTNSRIRKMLLTAQRVGTEDDTEKQNKLFQEILSSAESLKSEIEDNSLDDSNVIEQVDEIDMTSPESLKRALAAQHKKRNGSIVRFGLQGFNRMMGSLGGVAYGESLAFAGRSHNYKSGILLDAARWICMYNTPPDTAGRTPVVLFISLENEIADNLMELYRRTFSNIYHKAPSGFKDDEVIEFVQRRMSENGFKFLMIRRMGESFGYQQFVELVEKIEKGNCKVVATIMDYLTLSKRCPEDKTYNDAKQLQLMTARYKDFCAHRDMVFITGLQLETEASRLASSGMTCIAKRYTEFHLSDAKALKREFDILVFLEIESDSRGRPWLTACINKRRYAVIDPDDKYCGYLFTPLGIMDDIKGKDMSAKDIYAENAGDDDPGQGMDNVSIF